MQCRRYRCVVCVAVILVVPRGVAPRRHYSQAAIAMAMTLWAVLALPPARVRERICVSRSLAWGTEWSTLRRWARAARALVDLPSVIELSPAPITRRGPGDLVSDDSLRPRDHAEAIALFRAEVIGALAHREFLRGELRAALRALAKVRFRAPGSTFSRCIAPSTLERWIYRYRAGGLVALERDRAPIAVALGT